MIPLDELEKLAKAATPGTWVNEYPSGISTQNGHHYIIEEGLDKADSAYMAALSPDVVLELIAKVRRLEKEKDEWYVAFSDEVSKAKDYVIYINQLRAQLDQARIRIQSVIDTFPNDLWR